VTPDILDDMPIVLTSDQSWASEAWKKRLRPGLLVVLPEDAVLVRAPKEADGSADYLRGLEHAMNLGTEVTTHSGWWELLDKAIKKAKA
jgi:hypothetical protein